MDSDPRRDRNLPQRAFDSLTMGVAPATSADLDGSLASSQLTQLRMAFSSQANVEAFEQLASSLNAEMRSELAFEVPALAGASLTGRLCRLDAARRDADHQSAGPDAGLANHRPACRSRFASTRRPTTSRSAVWLSKVSRKRTQVEFPVHFPPPCGEL